MIACGLDFGTSNSAIGIARDGTAALAPVEADGTLIPSAVFFDGEAPERVLFGNAAIAAYIDEAVEGGPMGGRLMRALKSVLASPLIEETTGVGGRKIALKRAIELFLRHLKRRAEAFAGQELDTVLLGRPVRFHDDDDAADARAEQALEAIARQTGFRSIAFAYEPIAAAYHYEQSVAREELVLVADIGGGTSDFSLVRFGPQRQARAGRKDDVLAAAGRRVGGTDFDAALSRTAVMPLLGLGSALKEKSLPMPAGPYEVLANWATINFAYSHRNEREIAALLAQAREPDRVRRLLAAVRGRHGHSLALAVEAAKIALSGCGDTALPLGFLEPGLAAHATRDGFERAIAAWTDRLCRTAGECIAAAGLTAARIDTILLTGGSSRVPAVRAAIARAAPSARLAAGADDLRSVALGLTRMAARLGA